MTFGWDLVVLLYNTFFFKRVLACENEVLLLCLALNELK